MADLLNEITSGVNWFVDFVLVGVTVAIIGFLIWQSLLRTHFRGSINPLAGNRSRTGGTQPGQQQAQAGTTAAPPGGGEAAAPAATASTNEGPRRVDTPPAQTTTARPSGSSWGTFFESLLKAGVVVGAILFFVSFLPPNWIGSHFHRKKGYKDEPALEYHYKKMGEAHTWTWYSSDRITPASYQAMLQGDFWTAPPNGSSLFETTDELGRPRKVCDIWYPNSRKGETIHFQCWGRDHRNNLGNTSDQRDDPFIYLKNGRFDWVVGEDPWKCSYVVDGTEVLHAWTDSLSIDIKLMDRK